MHETLFDPLRMGAIEARNRVFMAPLTRGRSTQPGSVPNEMMETYYRQRAGAGLIITEATGVSVEGSGWPAAPGIWSEEQVDGWKPITRAISSVSSARAAS
jgi:N-ethylmaleimide reductase